MDSVLSHPVLRTASAIAAAVLAASLLGFGATPAAPGLIPEPWDKLVHLTTYGVFCALAAVALGRRRQIAAIALAILLGVGDETLQIFEPGRSSDLADLGADAAGAVLAATLLALVRRPRRGAAD